MYYFSLWVLVDSFLCFFFKTDSAYSDGDQIVAFGIGPQQRQVLSYAFYSRRMWGRTMEVMNMITNVL